MPTNRFALEPGGPKRIEVSWKGIWKNVTVSLDGDEVGRIPDQRTLKEGRGFTLPDGSHLSVKLKTGFGNPGLELLHDGVPLPGTAADPAQKLKLAAGITYFIGGLNVVLGIVALAGGVEFLLNAGIGVGSLLFGLLFLVLGYFVSKRSALALGVAVAVFIVDAGLSIAMAINYGGRVPTGGLVFRVLLIIGMFQGFGAIRALKQAEPLEPGPLPERTS